MMARDRERRFVNATESLTAWRKVCRVMGNSPRKAPSTLRVREEKTDVTGRTFTSISSASSVGSAPRR
jgi:hypothetical protein